MSKIQLTNIQQATDWCELDRSQQKKIIGGYEIPGITIRGKDFSVCHSTFPLNPILFSFVKSSKMNFSSDRCELLVTIKLTVNFLQLLFILKEPKMNKIQLTNLHNITI